MFYATRKTHETQDLPHLEDSSQYDEIISTIKLMNMLSELTSEQLIEVGLMVKDMKDTNK